MISYIASFRGREKGSIGAVYNISTYVKAENKKEAEIKLYKSYEHIFKLSLIEDID